MHSVLSEARQNNSFFEKKKLPTNCLSVFDHFVILALKGLMMFLN